MPPNNRKVVVMIHLVFDGVGSSYGWGICAKNIALEMSKLSHTELISKPFGRHDVQNDIEYYVLKGMSRFKDDVPDFTTDNPVIQMARIDTFEPIRPGIKGSCNIGYTFFEDTHINRIGRNNAKKHYDVLAAGSSWCEEVLNQHGIHNTATVLQGVDYNIFNSHNNQKRHLKDKFVIFSGGKFELRKGQDVVIKAFKVMQERHGGDVILVNAWYNPWPYSMASMALSQHVRIPQFDPNHKMNPQDYIGFINNMLVFNGIDVSGVITLPYMLNPMMASIYKNTDVGVFPNRCEGGTNLVLMEYLACGKPAIASYSSGHKDVLDDRSPFVLHHLKPKEYAMYIDRAAALWDEPDVDEVVEKLELAYRESDDRYINNMPEWTDTAEEFYFITTGNYRG